ncbi:MAG: hypothetical protein DIU83_09485 [Bacillota bacterium]|nr:MAG: hypothetical protein DIU83_09485 [Bacillota bacterium]
MTTADGVAPARDAATVILVKQPDFIYMTERPASLRVAGGFYVFPGGAVEEQDRAYARARPGELAAVGLDPEHRAFVAAGIRETFEEVGLLLAEDREGRPLWRPEGARVHAAALAAARARLNEGAATLLDVVAGHGWRLTGQLLGYVARWVTPPAARRRFNTRFFIADVTGGIEPAPFAPEVAAGEWLRLSEAVARHEAGTLPLMRPTRALIRELAAGGGAAEAIRRFRDPDAERLEVIEQNTPEVLLAVLNSQGVAMVPVPSPTLLPATTTNVFLVTHGGEAVLIDAGHGGDDGVALVRTAWERAGRPRVKALVLTHCHPDHAGGAAGLQKAFGCPLWAHPSAAETLRTRFGVEIGRPLEGGEAIPVGSMHLDVLHLPGHAPNHLCFFLRERAVLFTGDNVVGEGSSWVGPPDGDMALYLESLRKMQELPARIIAPGHGPALDEPRRRIQALIDRRLAREADIERLLREGPRTVEDLTEALYAGQVPGSVMEMARRTVLGHLIKLEREGRARPVEAGLWALGGSD